MQQDKHIGNRIKEIRQLQGMTLSDLGERVGVSSQQIQKYESGDSKISTDKLYKVADALEVRITSFFEPSDDLLSDTRLDITVLVRKYKKIQEPILRSAAIYVMDALAKAEELKEKN